MSGSQIAGVARSKNRRLLVSVVAILAAYGLLLELTVVLAIAINAGKGPHSTLWRICLFVITSMVVTLGVPILVYFHAKLKSTTVARAFLRACVIYLILVVPALLIGLTLISV